MVFLQTDIFRSEMLKRAAKSFRKPEPGFFLAVAFLVWSLLPHYQLVVHTHPGDGDGHRHATLSKSQMELADRMALALAASGEDIRPGEFSGEALPGPSRPSGFPALAPSRGASAHAHFQEDANVSALASSLAPSPAWPGAETGPSALPPAPDIAPIGVHSARGPPARPFLADGARNRLPSA